MATPKGVTGPVNVGNPTEFTILELAQLIIRMTGSKSKLVFMPLPQDDPQQRQPNIEKATQLLGWKPTVPLEQGLQSTIEYFDRHLKSSEYARPALPVS